MATYELWVGGGHVHNPNYEMWPNVPMLASDDIRAADHKQGLHYGLSRELDFRTGNDLGDQALQDFIRRFPLVNGDVLNIIAMPEKHSILELHYEVFAVGTTGLVVDIGSAADGSIQAALAGDALSSGVALATGWPQYNTANDMITLTMTTIPAAGVGDFGIRITPVVRHYNMGQY